MIEGVFEYQLICKSDTGIYHLMHTDFFVAGEVLHEEAPRFSLSVLLSEPF